MWQRFESGAKRSDDRSHGIFPRASDLRESLAGGIFFSSCSLESSFLSNFADAPFILDGARWKTAEHFYQAQKFIGTPLYTSICEAKTPQAAKELGQNREIVIPEDWNVRRVEVMRRTADQESRKNDDMEAVMARLKELLNRLPADIP